MLFQDFHLLLIFTSVSRIFDQEEVIVEQKELDSQIGNYLLLNSFKLPEVHFLICKMIRKLLPQRDAVCTPIHQIKQHNLKHFKIKVLSVKHF